MIISRKKMQCDNYQDDNPCISDKCHFSFASYSIILTDMIIKDKLIKSSLFYDLSDDQLDALTRLAVPCNFIQDDIVFEQNQYAEFLYIVLSGEICIQFKPHDGDEITVARVN